MSAPTLKEATDTDPGTSAKYGAPDVVEMAQLLMGTHPTEIIQENAIKNTAMTLGTGSQVVTGSKLFNDNIFKWNNPAGTFQYTVRTSAITANRDITIPLLAAGDTFVFANFIQTLTNKTIAGGSNSISGIDGSMMANPVASANFASSCFFVGSADNTKKLGVSLSGAATGKTTTLTFVQTDNRAITFPDFDATLATLAGTETLSGKTLTTPKIASGGYIADANGNELLIFTTTASAVNEATWANAATGSDPSLTMSGGDTDVGLKVVPKGAGAAYGFVETIEIPLSSDSATSAPSTGVIYTSLPMPADFKVIGVVGGVKTAGTGVALVRFDVLSEDSVNGNTFTTIFSTKPTIDASEFTTTTAATPYALTSNPTTIAKGKRVQYKIDQLDTDSAARGYKIGLVGYYTAKPTG